jgi:ketosteroid isomerase-like protein
MIIKRCWIILLLLTFVRVSLAQETNEDQAAAVVETLTKYAAAVQSKDIPEIEKYVVTTDEFTTFEGGNSNEGWTDYRDNHLAPELKEFLEVQYSYQDIKPHVMGKMAYATLKYNIAVKMKERDASAKGLATVILTQQDGGWKILHMHTSRIRKPKPDNQK